MSAVSLCVQRPCRVQRTAFHGPSPSSGFCILSALSSAMFSELWDWDVHDVDVPSTSEHPWFLSLSTWNSYEPLH